MGQLSCDSAALVRQAAVLLRIAYFCFLLCSVVAFGLLFAWPLMHAYNMFQSTSTMLLTSEHVVILLSCCYQVDPLLTFCR